MPLVRLLGIGAFNAMENLQSREAKWQESFVSCLSGIWHLLPSWALCRSLLRTIQLSLAKVGISKLSIPPVGQKILDRFSTEVWHTGDVDSVQSEYPVFSGTSYVPYLGNNIYAKSDAYGISDLLSSWDSFSLYDVV
jgi:hypothetical protein